MTRARDARIAGMLDAVRHAIEEGWVSADVRPSQSRCPYRGYLEFYAVAREFPVFRMTCDEAFGWVAHCAAWFCPES